MPGRPPTTVGPPYDGGTEGGAESARPRLRHIRSGVFPGGCSCDCSLSGAGESSKAAIATLRWSVELSAACFCSSKERLRSRYRERSSLAASSSWNIGSTGFASSPRLSVSVFAK